MATINLSENEINKETVAIVNEVLVMLKQKLNLSDEAWKKIIESYGLMPEQVTAKTTASNKTVLNALNTSMEEINKSQNLVRDILKNRGLIK